MTTFGDARDLVDARMPPDAITVPVGAWSPQWEDRPLTDVCLGLRTVAPRDLEDARKDAADAATRLYPRAQEGEPFFSLWTDHYYDMLLRSVVSRGTCDPNDVTQPWEGWRADPDELARTNLSAEGTKLIFDAWEKMRVASDVTSAPADDEAVEEMISLVTDIDKLPRARALRVRRLLAFCLAELRTLTPTTAAET